MDRPAPCAVINGYRVEVSGWDKSQSFFVEKAELEWNTGGEKLLTLKREVRQGCILFVRLLQPVSPDRSHPVPYAVEHAGQITDEEWQLRLTPVVPRLGRRR